MSLTRERIITINNERGVRLYLLIVRIGKSVLLKVFYKELPYDPKKLFQVLTTDTEDFKRNQITEKMKNTWQAKELFSDKNITYKSIDPEKLDITLMHFILKNYTEMGKDMKRKNDEISPEDSTIGTNIVKLVDYRNFCAHDNLLDLSESEFDETWKTVSNILQSLLLSLLRNKEVQEEAQTIELERLKKRIEFYKSSENALFSERMFVTSDYLFDGNEKLITYVCNNINSKWEFIGAFLCVDYRELNNIAAGVEDNNGKLRKVFGEKIGSEQGLNWASIQRALKCIGDNQLISELKSEYVNITLEPANENLEKPNWTYFMAYLSQKVAGFWMALARELPITSTTIDTIRIDSTRREPQSKAFAVLQIAYDEQEEARFYWNIVSNALKECRRWNVVREIESNEEFFHLTR